MKRLIIDWFTYQAYLSHDPSVILFRIEDHGDHYRITNSLIPGLEHIRFTGQQQLIAEAQASLKDWQGFLRPNAKPLTWREDHHHTFREQTIRYVACPGFGARYKVEKYGPENKVVGSCDGNGLFYEPEIIITASFDKAKQACYEHWHETTSLIYS